MTAAVASPTSVPLLADGGERERVRRGGGARKLSSIFSHRNVFVLRKKLRSSSLSATHTPASTASSRSSSTHLTSSCHAEYDHCSTSNSRMSTSPLSPHSVFSDSDGEEEGVHELHSSAPVSDEEERRDVVSPPSSCCSFSSTSSSSSGSSSSSFASSSSSTSLSPLPSHISPRSDSRARRRTQQSASKEAQTEQREAHATLAPPSPIVALPPLHPHALTQHAPLPLTASSPSLLGTPPSSYRQQPRQSSAVTVFHPQSQGASASPFSSPVRGHKHNRSHSASNQFVLLQGGAHAQPPSTRSSPIQHHVYASPAHTSPYPSPLPSPNIQPAPFSPHHHLSQQSPHQHHHTNHHRQQYYQHQQHFRQPPPSPLIFSPAAGRSAVYHNIPANYPVSPFLFLSQQQHSLSTPPSPTLPQSAGMQPAPSSTVQQTADAHSAGSYASVPSAQHPATTSQSAVSPPLLSSSTHHTSTTARPGLSRAASMLDTRRASSSTGSLLHPHPRRSSLLDLVALENSHGRASKPRSVSSAAAYPTAQSNSYTAGHDTSSYPSHAEVQRLLATPLAALLGLTELEPSRSHVPKAVARCAQLRNSPHTAMSGSSQLTPSASAVNLPNGPLRASSAAAVSPLTLHRELPPSIPSSPVSYANIAASLPRRLSITSLASSPVLGAAERERRLSSASSSSAVPVSPLVRHTPSSPQVALRAAASPSRTLSSAASTTGTSDSSSLAASPLLTASSRQLSQSKLAVAAAEEVAADGEWQTRKAVQKKQRAREVTSTDAAATEAASAMLEAEGLSQVTAALLFAGSVDSAAVVQQQPTAATETAATPVQPLSSPVVAVDALDEPLTTAAVESSKAQLDKKPRSTRNRARSTSNAAQPPTATDALVTATCDDAASVKSSRVCRTWSIRARLMALHSSFLATISAFVSSVAAIATLQWVTLCAFYHSLLSPSSSRRRFVSRLRSLSHATQQQTEQATPQPLKARHGHSLRYRHHPLLERQRLTKDSQPAGTAAVDEERELLMPRGLVVCMALCCMFLGVVVLTFVVAHHEQPSVAAAVNATVV